MIREAKIDGHVCYQSTWGFVAQAQAGEAAAEQPFGLVVIHHEDVSTGLVALRVHGVVRIDLQRAFGAGCAGHGCCGIVGGGESGFGLIPSGHGEHCQHDFPITASVLRTDNREALDHKPRLTPLAAANRSPGNQAVHACDHLLGGGGWSGICDLGARLRPSQRRKTNQKEGQDRERSSGTSHKCIVPEGRPQVNVSKELGLKFAWVGFKGRSLSAKNA